MQKTNINLGGVTRVPDDTMAQNGDLALALNLAADGDGLKMLEKPLPMFQLRQGETVLCVHQNDGYKHYITSYGGKLWWWGESAGEWSSNEIGTSGATQATVMGNTVITQGSKMEYWLWDEGDGGYRQLGERPPMVKIRFGLQSELKVLPGLTSGGGVSEPAEFSDAMYWDDYELPYVYWDQSQTGYSRDRVYELENMLPPSDVARVSGSGYVDGQGNLREGMEGMWSLYLKNAVGSSENSQAKIDEFVGKLTDWVMAYMNRYVAEANENSKFVLPFFVRYCYELYDGSQIMQSDPVLLIPNSRAPQFVLNGWRGVFAKRFDERGSSYNKVGYVLRGRLWGFLSELRYTVNGENAAGLRDWEDLVSGIGIYISAPIYTYDQDGKVYGWKEMHGIDWRVQRTYGKYGGSDTSSLLSQVISQNASSSELTPALYQAYDSSHMVPWLVMRVPELSSSAIRRRVVEATQYYKLASISFDDIIKWIDNESWPSNEAVKINSNVLSTLTNRRQLLSDYASSDTLSAGVQYVYNRRLHIANVSRRLSAPLDYWTQVPILGTASAISVPEAVEVVKNVTHVLVNGGSIACENHSPYWLYNRNDGARAISLDFGSDGKKQYTLSEHDNGGGYWLSSQLWDDGGSILGDMDTVESITSLPAAKGGIVTTEGEVWTSNAENPFVFQAGNVNQVGDGKVLALRAAVAPLAEDQHGYAPMYAFTSQGIWAMTHSKDGTPAAIDHICGDIITEGTEPLNLMQSCLVMTARGLLELSGRTVRNLSAKIDGEFASDLLHDYVQFGNVLHAAGIDMFDQEFAGIIGQPLRGKVCKLSYDYQHQRVYVWLSRGGWVLNLRTGLWTQTSLTVDHVYNAYPSCEFVRSPEASTGYESVVVSLDTEDNYVNGVACTRPIKLSEHLFKLREVAVRGFFNPDLQGDDAQVWTVLHGSRNWHNYGLVGSAKGDRVTRLGGSAYRSYVVTALLRSDSASIDRLVVSAEEEQGNKLR